LDKENIHYFNIRIDFKLRIISLDEKSRTFTVILEPDPRRYEWIEDEKGKYLYDKFDNIYIPEEVYKKLPEQVKGMPIYFQRQKIDESESYINSRFPLIVNMLKGKESTPTFKDKSNEFLQSLSVDKLSFAIISLDIVKSTKLATEINPNTYTRLISVVLFELSEIIPKFYGHVLKYTGDGLIAYFPEPSFIRKCDFAIDCALTLHGLVYKALNPIFREHNFPNIDIRIGLEAGEAYIKIIGSPETKQHKDIIGEVVNLAVKIQAQSNPKEIYIGEIIEKNLHTMWREICEPVKLKENWNYKRPDGKIYKIYKIKLKNDIAET
jgi:class 3 adenylate cyclase